MRRHKYQSEGIKRAHAARKLRIVRIQITKTAYADPGEQGADADQDGSHMRLQDAAGVEDQRGQHSVKKRKQNQRHKPKSPLAMSENFTGRFIQPCVDALTQAAFV